MTDVSNIITLRQPAKTGAERSRAYRLRRKARETNGSETVTPVSSAVTSLPRLTPSVTIQTTKRHTVTPSRSLLISSDHFLTIAAIALAGVGITMNGWFARSLGSSDIAGWLFLLVGVAADAVALVLPHCAAILWQRTRRARAAVAWLVWLVTFAFAIQAGIGFASVSISDVTMTRASRVTPAVTQAQANLVDAQAARDRECASGNGKNCRTREDQVVQARSALSAAQATISAQADPQTEAARHIVSWISAGRLEPSADDFAMLRLVLLALLPQAGGILLMLGRGAR